MHALLDSWLTPSVGAILVGTVFIVGLILEIKFGFSKRGKRSKVRTDFWANFWEEDRDHSERHIYTWHARYQGPRNDHLDGS